MDLISERDIKPTPSPWSATLEESAGHALADLLLGDCSQVELPALTDLTSAITALARGSKRKVLLPLAGTPAEFALVRRGDEVLVSCYGTGNPVEVHQLDRDVGLRDLLEACAQATLESARLETSPTSRQIAVRVAERAMRSTIEADPSGTGRSIVRQGGVTEAPAEEVPLAFGFEASIFPSAASGSTRSSVADVHALLFEGSLWAFVRGRRITLCRGPIMLAVQRMIVAVRALVEAHEKGRDANVRLRAGSFQIGIRSVARENVSVSLGAEGVGYVTAAALELSEATLPILRLAADLLRTLVSADRSQSRNIRVRDLRDEVRALRKLIQRGGQTQSFVNDDPDRLRLGHRPESASSSSIVSTETHAPALRFGERWRIAIDGLDAMSTFLCGDRMVLATPKHTVAISRDHGEVLWARSGAGTTAMMAGSVLLRLSPEGDVELCDVADGEPYATARITPRVGGPGAGMLAGGGSIPPVAILAEGTHRLVAIDLRTGEARWRFASRTGGAFRMKRVGRILLVACGEGSLHAIDVATGEDLWRFADRARFEFAPDVCRDVVVAVASAQGGQPGEAFGLDLYSGRPLWNRSLKSAPSAPPVAVGDVALLASGDREGAYLSGLDSRTGAHQWTIRDPGVGTGGASMAIDDMLVINAPGGRLSALDAQRGEARWTCELADPVADEVPRRLEPILRGGALFVPSSSVHALRPHDGTPLGVSLPCDLVPDLIRVDERSWVYVAEESGHIAAYAPVPHLQLIRGGA